MVKHLQLVFCLVSLVGGALTSAPCTNSSFCHDVFGNESYCGHYQTNSTGICGCNDFYYLTNTNCVSCPGYGENCEVSGCCNNADLLCIDKTCSCFWVEYCWIVDDGERTRLQIAAQIILAIALFLSASVLFILFWNSCARQSSVLSQHTRRVSQRNRLSLNSIHRLVLLQLQDRPPPYDSNLMSPSKHLSDSMDIPPSYTDAVQLPPLGEANLAFFFKEISPSTQVLQETSNETLRSNQNLPMNSQFNTGSVNQNELSVSEANLNTLETFSSPLTNVFPESSVSDDSLQSAMERNNNVSTAYPELHI